MSSYITPCPISLRMLQINGEGSWEVHWNTRNTLLRHTGGFRHWLFEKLASPYHTRNMWIDLINLARDCLAKKRTQCLAMPNKNLDLRSEVLRLPSFRQYLLYFICSRSLNVALQWNGLTVQPTRKKMKRLVLMSTASLCPRKVNSGQYVVKVFSERYITIELWRRIPRCACRH